MDGAQTPQSRPRGPGPQAGRPLEFRPVDRAGWDALEKLFGSRGAPKYCWCMAWRPMPARERSDGRAKRAALKRLVGEGVPVGILGYAGGEPAAWCSIAPRATYRAGLCQESAGEPDGVWSLACFFVPRALRRRGIAGLLLGAAIDHARGMGAEVVEAYPAQPGSPSYRFMGSVPLFAAAGFRQVGTAGSRRRVMRLWLRESGP